MVGPDRVRGNLSDVLAMVKNVSSTYITQESRKQGAQFVYKITYQKSAGSQITIPLSEVISAPSISNAIGRDFMALSGGDIQLTLDNRNRQWDDAYANAYNRPKYDGELRVSAGFALPSGTNEYVELFSGKIVNVEMSGVKPLNAVLIARNDLSDKIAKTMIGKPTSAGTPNPYLYGAISRVRMINLLVPDRNTWTFQYGGTINWLSITPAPLTRIDNISEFHIVTGASVTNVSDGTKTYRLSNAAVQSKVSEVWLSGVRKNSPGTQLPYLIKDILVNHAGIPTSHINATSLNRIRNLDKAGSWGIQVYNTGARDVIEHICHALYSGAFIEGRKFNLVSLGSPISSGIHLSDSDYQDFSFQNDKTRIINQAEIPYFTYPLNISRIKRADNLTSQATYGTLPLSLYYQDFSFTNMDSLGVYGATHGDYYQRLANTIVRHNAHAKRIFNLSGVYSKGLRVELGDRVRLSNAFFSINQASAVVIGKTVDLSRKRTDLTLMGWTSVGFNAPVFIFTELMDEVANLSTPGFAALMDETPLIL